MTVNWQNNWEATIEPRAAIQNATRRRKNLNLRDQNLVHFRRCIKKTIWDPFSAVYEKNMKKLEKQEKQKKHDKKRKFAQQIICQLSLVCM